MSFHPGDSSIFIAIFAGEEGEGLLTVGSSFVFYLEKQLLERVTRAFRPLFEFQTFHSTD